MKHTKAMLLIKAEGLVIRLSMRQWWEPMPETILNHVSAQVLQTLKEGGAGSDAAAATGMKKGELAVLVGTKLAGKGWSPEPLTVVAGTWPAGAGRRGPAPARNGEG